MKKLSLLWTMIVFLVFLSACKEEVDFFASPCDVPIVYAMLDADADTNFVKITRAFFSEDLATQTAQNPDSSNYPGRLDARLIEFDNGKQVREIILDTITIRDKEEGMFYAPAQKLYYTTERLQKNSAEHDIKYKLTVELPDQVLTAQAYIVGSTKFGVWNLTANFSQEYFGTKRELKFYPATHAEIYEIGMTFTYWEQKVTPWSVSDSVPVTMDWFLGTYYLKDFDIDEEGKYVVYYRPEAFYNKLRLFLGADTANVNVRRLIKDYPIEFYISAAGSELREYYTFSGSPDLGAQSNSDFSLINGGYGLFSSRCSTRRKARLAGTTVPDLVVHNWGFVFIGGE